MNRFPIRLNTLAATMVALLCTVSFGYASKIILTIPELRQLSVKEAQQGRPLDIKAQVVYIHHQHESCVIYDGKIGTYVQTEPGSALLQSLVQGDMIRVQGVSNEGGFAPSIMANTVEVVGHKPLPEATPFNDHQKMHTGVDCHWVKTFGRLVNYTICQDGKTILVEMERHDAIFDLMLPFSEENEKQLSEVIFRVVTFNAVAGMVFNERRQAIGRTLLVNSADDFIPTKKFAGFDVEIEVPVHELMWFAKNHRQLTRTFGTVIYLDPGEMVIRGEQACLRIILSTPSTAELGNKVAVVGFAVPGQVSPSFRARSIEVLDDREIPEAVPVELVEQIDPSLNYELIEIDAVLVEHGKRFDVDGLNQPTLLCRSEDHLFEARYPSGTVLEDPLVPGSKLRLVGICNVVRGTERRWTLDVVGFRLQLRGPEDVAVLIPPPWWNTKRLLWLAGITCSLAALLLIWVTALRKTVVHQTAVIGDQVERESVLKERQRIAREMHDNLAQGLVGMVVHLNGCVRRMDLHKEKVRELLKTSSCEEQPLKEIVETLEDGFYQDYESLQALRGMMDHCSEESRSSILYLRSGLAGRMGLLSTLQEVLEPLGEESGIVLDIQAVGEARTFDQELERNLMLVSKEVVTNAVRHAEPKRIEVQLMYEPDKLMIRIADNGKGFLIENVPDKGHYGITGMHERMKQFGGGIEIKSQPGQGTEVRIELDSTSKWEV